MLVSPSLEGVLLHESVAYEGVRRPHEVLRVLDGPSSRGGGSVAGSLHERQALEQYFHDLYGVFIKRLSYFAIDSDPPVDEEVKLQAMLQELIKIKGLISRAEQGRTEGVPDTPQGTIDL